MAGAVKANADSESKRDETPSFPSDAIAGFHNALQQWYQREGRRELPWRMTADPYPIWLSEVMLQQTQVKTVLERYYYPFLERFPNLEALAEAELQQVLKSWEGLGYYNRARNLHAAAQRIVENGFPQDVEGLKALPGIGQNTAHAVACFAFRKPVPVLEANVKRVIARIGALETPSPKLLWSLAQQLVNVHNPFDYNQAMMDVGAMLCTPRSPSCSECPAQQICKGKDSPQRYPQTQKKQSLPVRQKRIVLFRDLQGCYFLTPREGRFLHGLWQFPEVEATAEEIIFANQRFSVRKMEHLGSVAHSYSHFHLHAEICRQDVEERVEAEELWVPASKIADLPLSRTEKKILSLIKD